jgi:plasmid stabilization system protein ParE
MKIFYTQSSIADLRRVHQFIVQNNPAAANQIAIKIKQAIEHLQAFPLLGKEVKETKSHISLREIVTGNYLIRYAVFEHEIHILRIWHGKEIKPSIQ